MSYLAGVVDAKGRVRFLGGSRKTIALVIPGLPEDVVTTLSDLFPSLKARPSGELYVAGRNGWALMHELKPHLRAKQRAAELFLKWIDVVPTRFEPKQKLPSASIRARQRITRELKALTSRNKA